MSLYGGIDLHANNNQWCSSLTNQTVIWVFDRLNSAIERGPKPDALGRKPCHGTRTVQAAMVQARRAWQDSQPRGLTCLTWQPTVSMASPVSTRMRSCHSPR